MEYQTGSSTLMHTHPPRIFAIAGAPAAGKTTFVRQQIRAGVLPATAFRHDCDAVMQVLPGYQDDLRLHGSAAAFTQWELAARQLAEDALAQAVARQQDIIYDRSCALPSSLSFLQQMVQEKGYQLHFYYLNIDLQTTAQRAASREEASGRHIPAAIIQDRMMALQQLRPAYQQLAHYWYELHHSESTAEAAPLL